MLDEPPTSDEGSGSPISSEACLRLPWPDWFPPVTIHSPYGSKSVSGFVYCKDSDVNRAKSMGDIDAAFCAVDKFIDGSALEKISQNLCGITTYVVAPAKPPDARRNVLALTFAAIIAQELGIELADNIFQYPRAKRDKNGNFVFRIANAPEFFGDVVANADYVVVDDVLTYGGTLAGLRAYIECNGGRVICMSTLAGNPPGEEQIAVTPSSIASLSRVEDGKLNEFFLEVLGYGLDCFTEREAGKLRSLLQKEWKESFSLDFLRKRILRERREAAAG